MAQNPWGNLYSFVRLYKNHLNKHLSRHVWTGQVLCGMAVISDFALCTRIMYPGLGFILNCGQLADVLMQFFVRPKGMIMLGNI